MQWTQPLGLWPLSLWTDLLNVCPGCQAVTELACCFGFTDDTREGNRVRLVESDSLTRNLKLESKESYKGNMTSQRGPLLLWSYFTFTWVMNRKNNKNSIFFPFSLSPFLPPSLSSPSPLPHFLGKKNILFTIDSYSLGQSCHRDGHLT